MDKAVNNVSDVHKDVNGKRTENVFATFVVYAFNEERFIRESVASILAQTYSPLEIVLSDDGEWHVLMVDIKKPARAQCITLQEPPATLDLQPFFPNLSPAALDEALRMA